MKVLILRSLPGGGKSSYAKTLPGNKIICSADDYHTNLGKYEFKAENASLAHKASLRRCLSILERTVTEQAEQLPDYLIVDNTNCSAWEISPYYRLAELFGCEVKILTLWCSPELSMRRNIHNVPATTILRMYQTMLTEILPSHWKHEIILSE